MWGNYGIRKDAADSFFEMPALSFHAQDRLHSLFDRVLDSDQQFTLVIGAGVSLDAGLPSWGQLVANMINSASFDERWRQSAISDGADLMRKAETVLQIIMANRSSSRQQIVREALYMEGGGSDSPITPGRLADAIARLFILMRGRIGLVTTNFDTVLEDAINGYWNATDPENDEASFSVQSHVLHASDEPPGDSEWDPESSVMHLHGLLAPGEDARGQLVLTESDFLSVGPHVQRFLFARMKESVTIFIGVSLTDPNLVGPLWKLKEADADAKSSKTFVLSICTPRNSVIESGGDLDTAEAYEIKKIEALAKVLPVTPIVLKSYGQQMQLVNELSYALQLARAGKQSDYMDNDDPATSVRYGFRLSRVLDRAYTNINCSPDEDFPSRDNAKELSDRLFVPLDDGGALSALLTDAREELRISHSRSDRKIYEQFRRRFEEERFGLFLWLRSRISLVATKASYSLRLVGTSVYQHRAEWSLDRTAALRSITRFPVALAEFNGTTVLQDFETKADWQLWRSILAVPFSCNIASLDPEAENEARWLNDVPAGVISLNSNCYATRSSWDRDDPRSIMSAMYTGTFHRLAALLQAVAIETIGSARALPQPAPGVEDIR